MATVSRGHTFAADAEVTNITLHSMVDNASVNDITQDDVAANHGLVVTSVTAPVTNALWRDAGGDYKVKAYEPISGKWKTQADSDDISAVSGAVGTLGDIVDNSYFVDHKNISISFTDLTATVNGEYIFVEGYRVDLTGAITGNIAVDLDTGTAGNKWYSIIVAVKDKGADPKIIFSESRISENLPAQYICQRHVGYVYRDTNNIFNKSYDAFTQEVIGDLSGDIKADFPVVTASPVDISAYIPPSAVAVKMRYRYSASTSGQTFDMKNLDGSPGVPAITIVANTLHDFAGWCSTNGTTVGYNSSTTGIAVGYVYVAGFKQNTAKQSY